VVSVTLSPDSLAVAPGTAHSISASGKTASGSVVQPILRWIATGGTVSSTGKYTAGPVPGRFRVIASVSTGAADTAVVTIGGTAPILSRLELSPGTVSLNPGGTRQFSAVGKASDGTTVPVTARYSSTGGTITGSGLYTANQVTGTFRVVATDSATQKADTATVTIQTAAPTVLAVVLLPATVTLASGATQHFTASSKMSDGSSQSVAVTFGATGGAVSSSGMYTAGSTGGTFRVVATMQGSMLADTSVVTITAAPAPPPPPPPPPPTSACARTVNVSTVSALSNATSGALPGDCIIVAPGSYSVGVPSWTRSGTAAQPITLQGAGSATVFNLGGNGGIYLRANHWHVRKLRVTNGFFGIQTEGASYVELDSLEVDNMQQAAINLRYGTNRSVVKNSKIHDTGKGTKRYGEGVYIGGYATPANAAPDYLADDNQVLYNTFGPNVTAEAIDLSDGADRLTAIGNTIDGTGTVYEYGAMNSLIGVRGVGHVFTDNVLAKGAPHGIVVYNGSAMFRRNRISLQGTTGYAAPLGINRAGGSATVYCDNSVTNIQSGGAAYNVTCTP
jgi:hypothetical protein